MRALPCPAQGQYLSKARPALSSIREPSPIIMLTANMIAKRYKYHSQATCQTMVSPNHTTTHSASETKEKNAFHLVTLCIKHIVSLLSFKMMCDANRSDIVVKCAARIWIIKQSTSLMIQPKKQQSDQHLTMTVNSLTIKRKLVYIR